MDCDIKKSWLDEGVAPYPPEEIILDGKLDFERLMATMEQTYRQEQEKQKQQDKTAE